MLCVVPSLVSGWSSTDLTSHPTESKQGQASNPLRIIKHKVQKVLFQTPRRLGPRSRRLLLLLWASPQTERPSCLASAATALLLLLLLLLFLLLPHV